MTRIDFWTGVLGERVLSMCQEFKSEPSDYENVVRSWLKEISEESRPTPAGVIMHAKRKVYGLVPLR